MQQTRHFGNLYTDEITPRQVLVQRAGLATARVCYRTMPWKPNPKKWTKLGTALDWHLVAVGLNVLGLQLDTAYQEISISASMSEDINAAPDPELVQDVSWHELEGKRFRSYRSAVKQPSFLQDVTVLCVVMEPLRYLSRWFLRRSSLVRRNFAQARGRPPPLADLAWVAGSPITKVLQYVSHLMTGLASRLILLWHRKHNSFDEWCIADHAGLMKFRHVAHCASALVFQRHHQQSMNLPWLWVGVTDRRRSLADRELLASEIVNSSPETRDVWFTEEYFKLLPNWQALFTAKEQRFIWQWGWSAMLTVAGNEFLNGRNRKRTNANLMWQNYAAHCYHQER